MDQDFHSIIHLSITEHLLCSRPSGDIGIRTSWYPHRGDSPVGENAEDWGSTEGDNLKPLPPPKGGSKDKQDCWRGGAR